MLPTNHLRAAVAGVVTVLAAGCASPTSAPVEEITRWMESHEEAPGSDIGVLQARVSPSSNAPEGEEATVEISYEQPAHVDAVSVECFGDGSVDITLLVTSTTADGVEQTSQTTAPQQPCGGPAHSIPLDADSVTTIGVSGSGADQEGAWSAHVLGTVPG